MQECVLALQKQDIL